jgi:hypothetical protein
VVLQSSKESPTRTLPAFDRDAGAKAIQRLAHFRERMAAYSATLLSTQESLLSAQSELADQERRHRTSLSWAALIAFGIALACAVLLVLRGVVLGLTELFGGRVWLASLTTGLLVLLAFLAVMVLLARRHERESRTVPRLDVRRRNPGLVTRHTLF